MCNACRLRITAVAAVFVLVLAASATAQQTLRYETKDWVLTAPATLGTQADLELNGRQLQLCHDQIVKLTGYRPPTPAKFTVEWVIDESTTGAWAGASGWVNHVPSTSRLVEDYSRSFREDLLRRGVCFGPHEVTHVLTSRAWPPAWANEGLATFTDQLYQRASWSCCSLPLDVSFRCEAAGYVDGLERKSYSDLSPFVVSWDTYRTASCFWSEVYARGGFPAVRGILAGLRRQPATTTGEFVLHHVNRVLSADLRPVVERYGFEPSELEAGPTPAIPGCTLIGMATGEVITGTTGSDTICGLGGNDRLAGGAGTDVLDGGQGDDVLNARDGARDVVRGGPGRDTARVDRIDVVSGVEKVRR